MSDETTILMTHYSLLWHFISIAPNCAHRQQKFTAEHAESAEKKQEKSLLSQRHPRTLR
jgi:hypothetical protein